LCSENNRQQRQAQRLQQPAALESGVRSLTVKMYHRPPQKYSPKKLTTEDTEEIQRGHGERISKGILKTFSLCPLFFLRREPPCPPWFKDSEGGLERGQERAQVLRDDGEAVGEDQHADDDEQDAGDDFDGVIVFADAGRGGEELVDGQRC